VLAGDVEHSEWICYGGGDELLAGYLRLGMSGRGYGMRLGKCKLNLLLLFLE